MEDFSEKSSSKGILISYSNLGLSITEFKAVLIKLPIKTRCIYIDQDDSEIFAIFEFIEPAEIQAFTSLLERNSIKPDSIELIDIESDSDKNDNDEEEHKIESIPAKRANQVSIHDLESMSHHIESTQSKLAWLDSEFEKIYLKSKQPNAILTHESDSSSSDLTNSSESSDSSFLSDTSSDISSESSEDSLQKLSEDRTAVLRESLNEIKDLNSAPAELGLKRICIRSGENYSSLDPSEFRQTLLS